MTTPTITDLHTYLFEVLAKVKAGTMTVEQAQVSSHVAQTIINTAKVEVEYLRVTGQKRGSGFLSSPGEPAERQIKSGTVRVVQHRIGDT